MDSPSSLLCGEKLVFSAMADYYSDLKTLANVASRSGRGVVSRRKARGESVSILSSDWSQRRGLPANPPRRSSLQPNSSLPGALACHQPQQVDYMALDIQQVRCLATSKGFGHSQHFPGSERRRGGGDILSRGRSSAEVGEDFLAPPGVCQDSLSLLLGKAAQPYYRVSKLYVEKLLNNRAFGSGLLEKRRRESVNLIFKLASLRRQSTLLAAHAVAFLDRFLSQKCSVSEKNDEMALLATACFWIAAKMEDSATPNLSTLLGLETLECDEESILKMEVEVLRALGWRMLSVTISDFVASILEGLQSLGLSKQRWMEVTDRADEIIHGILPGSC